jgi:hypothetical protein
MMNDINADITRLMKMTADGLEYELAALTRRNQELQERIDRINIEIFARKREVNK